MPSPYQSRYNNNLLVNTFRAPTILTGAVPYDHSGYHRLINVLPVAPDVSVYSANHGVRSRSDSDI
jgi:hypothetical protein